MGAGPPAPRSEDLPAVAEMVREFAEMGVGAGREKRGMEATVRREPFRRERIGRGRGRRFLEQIRTRHDRGLPGAVTVTDRLAQRLGLDEQTDLGQVDQVGRGQFHDAEPELGLRFQETFSHQAGQCFAQDAGREPVPLRQLPQSQAHPRLELPRDDRLADDLVRQFSSRGDGRSLIARPGVVAPGHTHSGSLDSDAARHGALWAAPPRGARRDIRELSTISILCFVSSRPRAPYVSALWTTGILNIDI
ncbi:hypothetical protein QE410_001160 [Microbacterium sp. SORGH_AS 1204]|nr:hypothetical protein [Microbacterium sp. SORGH_AS_1204]